MIDKMDSVFGIVLSPETLAERFYKATKKADEKVVMWRCRLESMLVRIVERGLASDKSTMLRNKCWHGLYDSTLTNVLRYRFDLGGHIRGVLINNLLL